MNASRDRRPNQGFPSEERLVREFLLGEASAVAHVQRLITRVVRFRGYYVPDGERPDLIQEVLLKLWQALARPGFVFTEGLAPFVRSLAHRRCVDWMRRQRARDPLDSGISSRPIPPDEELLQNEQRGLAQEVLRELPEPCRELIRLHAAADLTYRQIADRLGRSEGALRTQMSECLKEARTILRRRQNMRHLQQASKRGSA